MAIVTYVFSMKISPYIRSLETDFHNSMFYGNVSSYVYRTMLIYAQVPVSIIEVSSIQIS